MESMTEAGGKKGVLCEGCRVGRTQDEKELGTAQGGTDEKSENFVFEPFRLLR